MKSREIEARPTLRDLYHLSMERELNPFHDPAITTKGMAASFQRILYSVFIQSYPSFVHALTNMSADEQTAVIMDLSDEYREKYCI